MSLEDQLDLARDTRHVSKDFKQRFAWVAWVLQEDDRIACRYEGCSALFHCNATVIR